MVDIEVYSKPKHKLRHPSAEWLPSTPFLMGVSGPSMSGKGVLVQNIIMNPNLVVDPVQPSCQQLSNVAFVAPGAREHL